MVTVAVGVSMEELGSAATVIGGSADPDMGMGGTMATIAATTRTLLGVFFGTFERLALG